MSAQPVLADLPTVKVSTRFELDAGPARHRIGLIALDSDVATERDFHAMLPPDVMFYTSADSLHQSDHGREPPAAGPIAARCGESARPGPAARLDCV